ncbi:MAG: tetratricopeptide repeat protein [Deltaproteobacteria bacterium]|nr:tetratricopeptide repeat protein [Deltaproteobacteria bacterium]
MTKRKVQGVHMNHLRRIFCRLHSTWYGPCVVLLWLAGAQSAAARPAIHKSDKAKNFAPTIEDNANYYAKNRRNISEADLKKADQLRLKTVTSIEDLLKSKKGASRRFELLLRLGELHVERHDYVRDSEMMQYEKAWDSWSQAKSKDPKTAGPEPKLSVASSNDEMLKASESFRKLVTEFPKHPRTDAALYSLARVLTRLGKDSAVEYYQRLIKGFPKSPLLPDTYLSLGEYYFDKHDIGTAIENYKKVMQFKDNKAYPYAVYKLGWAYYNAPAKNDKDTQENYRKAVAAFKLVVKISEQNEEYGAKSKSNVNLRDEALNDLVLVWADGEDVDAAWKYFQTVGSSESFYKMLERLGNIYTEQGRNQQAIVVYQRLLREMPVRPTNPEVSVRLVELYDLTGNVAGLVTELQKMKKTYIDESPWRDSNAKNQVALNEARHQCELTIHRYGAMFHQRAQKTKNAELFATASDIYGIYLATFPDTPAAYDIRYYLAEIHFDRKEYEKAATHYSLVAKADPKGKYMKAAAFNAVAAINQLVVDTKWPDLPPAGQVAKPIDIPAAKQKLIQVIDLYVSLLPQEKDGDAMRFTAAQTYFDYGHYADAMTRFEKITVDIPNTKQARTSVRMIMGFYAAREDWGRVTSWGQKFLAQDKILDEPLKKYVTELLQSATFKQALVYEKEEKFEAAATSFMAFQKQFPTNSNADRAVYNAMLNFYKVGKIEQALEAGNLLINKYPKSPMVVDTMASVASTEETLAKFEAAAKVYHRLASQFPQDKRAAPAMYNAAILYKGINQLDQSVALLRELGQRFATAPQAAEANMTLAEILERQGRYPDAIHAYQIYVKQFGDVDTDLGLYASAKSATLTMNHGDKANGQKALDKVIKRLTAKNAPTALAARSTVAQILFKQSEVPFRDYMDAALNDGGRVEKQVSDKQAKLVKLAASFERIIDLGSPEFTVASLYRLGEAHENFANALFKVPAPNGATPAATDKLRTELEKVALPLRDEAYKFFETAYQRSKEVDTFTTWTRLTYQKMVELAPDKHPSIDELSAEPGYLSHSVKIGQPISDIVSSGI